MFVQTQLHLSFKIITISLWSMIIWWSVPLRRTICGDIDWHWHHQSQLAWPWWWIRSGCWKSSISMQEFILQLSSCCFQELFCDCAGQTCFFFHSYFVQYVNCCQRYLAVEDAVWLSRRSILSVFVSEEIVFTGIPLQTNLYNDLERPSKSLLLYKTIRLQFANKNNRMSK